MRPFDGLFVLRLDLPAQPPSLVQKHSIDEASKNSSDQQKTQSSSSPAMFLNSCRLLCRLRCDGSKCGAVSGQVKLLVVDNENNNINNNCTQPPSNRFDYSKVRARITPDSTWLLGADITAAAAEDPASYRDLRSFYLNNAIDTEVVMSVDFGITLDHLDGVLLQVAHSLSNEINNTNNNNNNNNNNGKTQPQEKEKNAKIQLRFTGCISAGIGVGKAQVTTGSCSQHISVINNKTENGSIVTQELRMILTEVSPNDCCSFCHNPINLRDIAALPTSLSPPSIVPSSTPAISTFAHPTVPECLVYCSEKCKSEHEPTAKILLPHLIPYASKKAGKTIVSFANSEFLVFWRSVTATTFLLLVEPRNTFGICYEILLDLFIDARQGLKINMIHSNNKNNNKTKVNTNPQYQDDPTANMINLNIVIYEAVIYGALKTSCVALASCCLNQLHVWCDHAAYLERAFLNFWDFTIGGGWDGLRLISTLGEYIMLVRPIFECATVLVESGLKSSLSNDFWLRLDNAKGILISLYNINGSVSFTPAVAHLRATLVPEQQRETLLLLAKVFLLMAARLPEEAAQRMLNRAEECYTDAIEEDRLRQNLRRMAMTTLSMSALCSLIKGAETKSQQLRTQGIVLLQSVAASPTAHRQQQQHCVSTIISTIGTSDELGAGVVEKQ